MILLKASGTEDTKTKQTELNKPKQRVHASTACCGISVDFACLSEPRTVCCSADVPHCPGQKTVVLLHVLVVSTSTVKQRVASPAFLASALPCLTFTV